MDLANLPERRYRIPYTPRPQFIDYHNRKERWALIVAHRRFGKTVGCVNDLVRDALRCKLTEPRFAYVAPTYAQAKDVAWGYLKQFGLCIAGAVANESELHVTFPNGGRVRLYGSDNYDRMRGLYFDGVVSDEYGDQDPRAWTDVIRPALSDRGGWGTFIGTPKGANHFKDLADKAESDPRWFKRIIKASQTGLLSEEELFDARSHMTAEQYAAEYECSFAGSLVGAYYAKLIEELEEAKRVGNYTWDPAIAVYTAWDLGIGDSTAIWFFQVLGNEIHVIDYVENNGVGLAWYVKQLKEERPNYVYERHFLPHDAEARELGTGLTRVETLDKLGLHTSSVTVLPQQSVDDGINAVRNVLPRCYFDAKKCESGLLALKNYKKKWDDKRKCFQDYPFHDWTSHGADAFRELAMGLNQATSSSSWAKPIAYPKRRVI